MTSIGILQILVFFGLILLVTKPVGLFMSRLFQGQRTFLHPILRPVEVLVYKLCGVREDQEQRWTQYTASLLAFSLFAFLFPYALMRLQGLLPLNPQGFGASQVSPDQSFNTAISFMTNTNWQWYSGESAMSYLVQMAALAVQNFVSAAAGLAVAIALIRGFARHETDKIGNFWVDLTRG
ncbi:MAG: potassium-transporting ATPase subunit KdpA, partial [Vicinamibacterales bacterium]